MAMLIAMALPKCAHYWLQNNDCILRAQKWLHEIWVWSPRAGIIYVIVYVRMRAQAECWDLEAVYIHLRIHTHIFRYIYLSLYIHVIVDMKWHTHICAYVYIYMIMWARGGVILWRPLLGWFSSTGAYVLDRLGINRLLDYVYNYTYGKIAYEKPP